MTGTLTAHLGKLAATLNDLRRRCRQAARAAVARAVGEALREVALAMRGGPERFSLPTQAEYLAWDDPWQGIASNPWYPGRSIPEEVQPNDRTPSDSSPLLSAVVIGLGAARWALACTGQLAPAVVIGLVIALATFRGAPPSEFCLGPGGQRTIG